MEWPDTLSPSRPNVDFVCSAPHFPAMTDALSKDAESYVTEVMGQLSAERADEVVNWLLLKQRADDTYDLRHPPQSEEALVGELLEAVRAPHRPYEPGEFRRRAQQRVTERESQ